MSSFASRLKSVFRSQSPVSSPSTPSSSVLAPAYTDEPPAYSECTAEQHVRFLSVPNLHATSRTRASAARSKSPGNSGSPPPRSRVVSERRRPTLNAYVKVPIIPGCGGIVRAMYHNLTRPLPRSPLSHIHSFDVLSILSLKLDTSDMLIL
ncbi:hypothetical protein B0H34DRAFT_802249 [Crassisporium funariophilum]|nr:hypothetical protein B0H34DRAFT_802249 [Crassisporium funariophilum]